ncbi:MAG: hypothetical protein K2X48_10350 [Chitinophagaceae bacterium]|nr:hypothetical protein [Chitinophagaceae bacterium]
MKLVFAFLFLLYSCLSFSQEKSNKLIITFQKYITGDFDNSEQVVAEIKAGKQIHPLAIHVNRVASNKIKNLPADFNGFFIIEESYYLNEGKPVDIKPFLFLFQAKGKNEVQLTVYQIPEGIKKEEFRNDNENLAIDYNMLKPSPTFKGAVYTWNAKAKTFSTNAPNDLDNGLKFTLIETFTANELSVMELLEKDGKHLTAYDTPIIYKRKVKP